MIALPLDDINAEEKKVIAATGSFMSLSVLGVIPERVTGKIFQTCFKLCMVNNIQRNRWLNQLSTLTPRFLISKTS